MKAEFGGVAFRERVLDIDVGDPHLLVPEVKGIQTAVGVFFEEIKVCQVVVDPIGAQIAEQTDGGVLVHENKAAEIAVEALNARANRDEIEIGAEIVNFYLREAFLQPGVRIEAIGSGGHIHVDNAALLGLKIIQIHDRRDAHAELHRLEGRVAAEQIKRKAEALVHQGLLPASEN